MIDPSILLPFRRTRILIMLLCMISILAVSCSTKNHAPKSLAAIGTDKLSDSSSAGLRKVRLMPYWVTSAQFAGYYVGIEKGIFLKH